MTKSSYSLLAKNCIKSLGNNPLKYIDPTGHGKEEAVEEGAVGGVNNVETEKPAPRKYRIGDSVFVALGFCLCQL
jgi:hypothetical protein